MMAFTILPKAGFAVSLFLAFGLPFMADAQSFKYWNPLDEKHVVPPTLSAMGLYADIASKNKNRFPTPTISR